MSAYTDRYTKTTMIKTVTTFPEFIWYQVHEMDDQDRTWLTHDQHIPHEIINYAIDPYESARMEYDDTAQLTLMILDVVTPTSTRATTEPVGLLFSNDQKHLYTFTRRETAYVNNFLSGTAVSREELPNSATSIDIILNGAAILAAKFMSAILEINRRRNPIQREIHRVRQTQKMIDSLMDLQTDLIYLVNSLHTDADLLRAFRLRWQNRLTSAQIERIDDVLVEITQAMDTGDLSREVTRSVSDAYVNLANSNLNWTMKLLTVSSIILTMPTIVSGFFGENVALPFTHTPFGGLITLIIMLVFMIATALLLWWKGFFDK